MNIDDLRWRRMSLNERVIDEHLAALGLSDEDYPLAEIDEQIGDVRLELLSLSDVRARVVDACKCIASYDTGKAIALSHTLARVASGNAIARNR